METDKETFEYLWKALMDGKREPQIFAGYEGEDASDKIICIVVDTIKEYVKDDETEKTMIKIRPTEKADLE